MASFRKEILALACMLIVFFLVKIDCAFPLVWGVSMSVSIYPEGGGIVDSDSFGFSCGNDIYSCYYLWNQVLGPIDIELKASPMPGFTFHHWDDGNLCYYQNPKTVSINGLGNWINAVFVRDYNLAFVYPVLGVSRSQPLNNTKDPLSDGWKGYGVGKQCLAPGHLGQDYYLKDSDSAGEPVWAIADGEIVEVLNGPGKYGWKDDKDHGWGPVVVIRHENPSGFKVSDYAILDPDNCGTERNPTVIYSLYGHLSLETLRLLDLYVGKKVKMGEQIGNIGKYLVDISKKKDGWTNHLHFEIKDEAGFLEGAWYTDKKNQGKCSGSIRQYDDVQGVGTGYSYRNGFAPHRYIPHNNNLKDFISDNMIP